MEKHLTVREQRAVFRALRILETHFKAPEVKICSPAESRDYLRLRFAGNVREELHILWLNSQNRLIEAETMFVGTLTETAVYPREIVRAALKHNAAAIILAHNHPSGEATPSAADVALTGAVKKALALVDVRLLDHFIVTECETTSLAEAGHV